VVTNEPLVTVVVMEKLLVLPTEANDAEAPGRLTPMLIAFPALLNTPVSHDRDAASATSNAVTLKEALVTRICKPIVATLPVSTKLPVEVGSDVAIVTALAKMEKAAELVLSAL